MFRSLSRWLVVLGLLLPMARAAEPLRVAAAADLQPVLPPLLREFESKTGTPVQASYQSSSTLATQILNGAPFDLFLAADMSFPQRIVDAGLADSTQPQSYARGTLVLWARRDSPLQPLSLKTLGSPKLTSLAIANPDHAPYGRAAKAALTSLGSFDSRKLVVAENIAQAAQYVDSGNAELGLISLTSALSDRMRQAGSYLEIPAFRLPADCSRSGGDEERESETSRPRFSRLPALSACSKGARVSAAC